MEIISILVSTEHGFVFTLINNESNYRTSSIPLMVARISSEMSNLEMIHIFLTSRH
jgi:hypothetical protein